ncbi:MAG TPA: hypothetical protein DEA96_04105 [Leptospiraceae bacterium]|nr:hypothetical protein [Spirochaetaceae bacterium]HBS04125.1 hypothetical protein [Leptospiraceae bacterium]|tara:strand:- start:56052 stop:56351 length:300 start_codon:yes stop_codon:yes gene_type:complete
MPEKIHHAVPAGKEEPRDSNEEEKATGWQKIVWIIVAILSGVYIVIPEATDFFPVVGWLDEGLAAVILTTALGKLGIRIPFLDALMRRKSRKGKKTRED